MASLDFLHMERYVENVRAKLQGQGVSSETLQGYSFILIVAAIWVTASFIVQEIVAGGISPFLLTYFCNSMFVIYLPVVEGARWWERCCCCESPFNRQASVSNLQKLGNNGSQERDEESDKQNTTENREGKLDPYTRWETAQAALVTCPVWFCAQFFFNLSLSQTSVTANTILSSLATLFTFLLSVALLSERFTGPKLGGVALCMLGTALVTAQDSQSDLVGESSSFWGDALCLVSAFLYAVYTVMIRKMLPNDGQVNMALFFGYIGLFNAVLLAPLLLLPQVVGTVDLTSLDPEAIKLTFIKGFFDNVLSDYLWARAVLLVGPTIASAGMGVQVPLAIFVEAIIGRAAWLNSIWSSSMMIGGGAAIVSGFIIVSTQPYS